MRLVIVTGMSGAGKSTALKVFEDGGFYCVDNMPIQLIQKFVELAVGRIDKIDKIALGIDVRNGGTFKELSSTLERLAVKNCDYEILFLEADDDVLIKRYKETRRNHPLAGEGRVDEGIELERKELGFLKKQADYIIDTSNLLTRELKQELERIFIKDEKFNNLIVTILSFGFKYGIPADSDLVFDVRFLPNPYYIEELKPLTGNDKLIQDFVMGFPQTTEFIDKLEDLITFLIPNYILEGKNRLVISIGCTGGKHRSVTISNELYKRLKNGDFGLKIEHRDILNDAVRKK